MKKLTLVLASIILNIGMTFAQLEEGQITYEIEMSSDDPELSMAVMMFSGSKMNLYFADKKARTDLEMGSMMSMSTVIDSESGEILMLLGGMIGDKAVRTTTEEMTEDSDADDADEPTITLTKEKKEIAGYKCKKAIITDADGNEMEYWYTEEIPTVSTEKNAAAAKLPGLALEYSIDKDGMIMSFTATSVKTKLDKETIEEKLSLEIPEGYEEMTYEEFTSMGMGM